VTGAFPASRRSETQHWRIERNAGFANHRADYGPRPAKVNAKQQKNLRINAKKNRVKARAMSVRAKNTG
jgi:hypothetical protein